MKPEEKFHEHHERLIADFEDHYEQARKSPDDSLGELVTFLRDELLPHARAEENELYTTVDELSGSELATASMRRDHRILEDRIDALATDGDKAGESLRRKLDEFSTILLNHFHKEEDILIPFLSETLNQDEFEALLTRVHESEESLRSANTAQE